MKSNSLKIKVLLDSIINEFSTIIWYMVSDCLSRNKNFNIIMMEIPILFFSGELQAYWEIISMTFKMYLNLSLRFERELKSAIPISNTSSIFVTIYGLRGNLLRTGLCKLYVFWRDNHPCTSLYLVLLAFLRFDTDP